MEEPVEPYNSPRKKEMCEAAAWEGNGEVKFALRVSGSYQLSTTKFVVWETYCSMLAKSWRAILLCIFPQTLQTIPILTEHHVSDRFVVGGRVSLVLTKLDWVGLWRKHNKTRGHPPVRV